MSIKRSEHDVGILSLMSGTLDMIRGGLSNKMEEHDSRYSILERQLTHLSDYIYVMAYGADGFPEEKEKDLESLMEIWKKG